MTEMQMLPEQARIVFDAVLQIDLQNGTYKTVSPCTGEETPGENGAYAEWAGRLTENADGENRQKLLSALGLERVQKELEQHGRYEVFGGEDTDCKRLIFLRCGDGRHAMLYVTDLGRIADYYKNLHGRMEKEQYKDPITGGLNRSYYEKSCGTDASAAGLPSLILMILSCATIPTGMMREMRRFPWWRRSSAII